MVDQLTTTILANATNNNVNSGRTFERAPTLVQGRLYCAGSAAGLTCALTVGTQTVTPATAVNAQNRLPVVPDDMLTDFIAQPGELIQITVVNTTAGNLDFNHRIEMDEVVATE